LEFTPGTLNKVLNEGFVAEPVYDYGAGPINVKVVDPLNLKGGYFECKFRNYLPSAYERSRYGKLGNISDTRMVYFIDSVSSEKTIKCGQRTNHS
jgi:hypothetical protein